MTKRITLVFLGIVIFTVVAYTANAEFKIVSAPWDLYDPSIDSNIIVWSDYRAWACDIYGYDLATATEFSICTNPANQNSPAISGNIMVWEDQRNGNGDIYGYNLNTSMEFPICTKASTQYNPKISGNIVVWCDSRNGNYDIYGYILNTSTEFPICTYPYEQDSPAISGDIVVWKDNRNGNSDIYGYNLITATEFPVCTDSNNQYAPAISGNIIVWLDYRNGKSDIYGYNLTTSTEFPICTTGGGDGLSIGGNTVIWYDAMDYSLHLYNLQSSQEGILDLFYWTDTTSTDGNFIVWSFHEDVPVEDKGIWGLHLNSPDEHLWPIEVNKTVPYHGSNAGMTGMAITSCGYNDFKDIWHSFTPTVSADYTISLCGSSFDTTLAVFDANKEAEIVCNDDSCGYQSQLTLKAKAGKQYLIRVAGYDGDAGDYVLTISGGADCINRPSADLNGDCKVDFYDIAVVCSQWLDCGLDDPDACWP
jgi:TolB protein